MRQNQRKHSMHCREIPKCVTKSYKTQKRREIRLALWKVKRFYFVSANRKWKYRDKIWYGIMPKWYETMGTDDIHHASQLTEVDYAWLIWAFGDKWIFYDHSSDTYSEASSTHSWPKMLMRSLPTKYVSGIGGQHINAAIGLPLRTVCWLNGTAFIWWK